MRKVVTTLEREVGILVFSVSELVDNSLITLSWGLEDLNPQPPSTVMPSTYPSLSSACHLLLQVLVKPDKPVDRPWIVIIYITCAITIL